MAGRRGGSSDSVYCEGGHWELYVAGHDAGDAVWGRRRRCRRCSMWQEEVVQEMQYVAGGGGAGDAACGRRRWCRRCSMWQEEEEQEMQYVGQLMHGARDAWCRNRRLYPK